MGVRCGRVGAWSQPTGSTTIAVDAASASVRNVSGRARDELAQRGLHLGSGRRRRAGDEEQGPGLGGGEPAQVGAAAAEQLPAAVAALLGVDRGARPCRGPRGRGGRCARRPRARRRPRPRSPGLATAAAAGWPPAGRLAFSHSDRSNRPHGDRFRGASWPHGNQEQHQTSTKPSTRMIPRACSRARWRPPPRSSAPVSEDQLDLPTPCSEFDVRGARRHLMSAPPTVASLGRGEDYGTIAEKAVPFDEWRAHWAATSAPGS